jgi:hypothetical protein
LTPTDPRAFHSTALGGGTRLASRSLDPEEKSAMERAPQTTQEACLRCGGPLHSMGVEEFRIGGTSGGWKLLFGELAELGEDMLKLEVLASGNCRRVELRVP